MGVKATVDERGRLCIPAEIRKELDFREGDSVIVEPVRLGEFRVVRVANAVEKGRGLYKEFRKAEESVASELIEDRRRESKQEDGRSE